MSISAKRSRINVRNLLWHTVFLAIASSFMDVDTVMPSMLIKAGGTPFHLGLLTAIMIGGTKLFQLIFASYLSNKVFKKPYLIIGISFRVLALIAISFLFYNSISMNESLIILLIFVLVSIFSLSGSFAAIPYNDILGKSIKKESRKKFFSLKQTIFSIGIFLSALLVRNLITQFEYPFNYGFLFMMAGILLFIASLGFWNIKENYSPTIYRNNIIEYFKIIPFEIKRNPNLKNYLFIVNSLGLGISILPFLIFFAKENFGLSYSLIGNFLLLRTIGALISSLLFYKIAQKIKYKTILKTSLIFGASLPIIALLLDNNVYLYQMLFLLSGAFVAMYKIGNSGILLEISTNGNRGLYTGIIGAGSIVTAIFPLIAGILISNFGYTFVFITISTIVLASIYFVSKLNCDS